MAFKGIGEVGADIFFREMQGVWPEHFPFLDRKARAAAHRLGLPETAQELADLVGRDRFPPLVTALTRAELADLSLEDLMAEADRKTP